MQESKACLIGHILDIQGAVFTADLVECEDGVAPCVTIGDEDILVGRLGSYVRIVQGEVCVVAMVTRMSERERLPAAQTTEEGAIPASDVCAVRTIQLVPIGCLDAAGEFKRGISVYPTTGAEVHAIGSSELDGMFRRFRDKKYDVGVVSSSPKTRVHLDPTPLFGRHCAILGQTGAGKSWTVASLLQKAVALMPRAHVVLLDLHGEYRSAFSASDARVINATEMELPYWLMTYAELCDLLIEHSEREATNQTAFFRDCLLAGREHENATATPALGLARVTVDTPIYFSLDGILAEVRAKNVERVGNRQGPMFGDFDRFLMRIESKLNDVRYDFLLKPKKRANSGSLAELLRDFIGLGTPKAPITVIDLSPVPFDVRPTVTAQIGRLAFEFNYWNPQYEEFPILLVCEEAHAYITREADSQYEGARRSMERIAKEGRKYGVGLTVVSQRPHEVSETVLSQCCTFICLRITNPDDQEYVRKLVPEAERDLVNVLAGMCRGEGLVLGEAAPMPTRVQFDIPSPTPRSNDVDFYKHWTVGPEDIDVAAVVDRWRKQAR